MMLYSAGNLWSAASRSIDAMGVLAHLDHLVTTATAPKYLQADSGSAFPRDTPSDFCEELGVTL
ncbi:MAG: hypothetical protein ACP5O0_06840 [Acidimicrobiales bacterium]